MWDKNALPLASGESPGIMEVPTQVTPMPEFDRVVNERYQELAQTCSRTSNQRVLMFLNKLLYHFTYSNY